jgi:hypothetical protein
MVSVTPRPHYTPEQELPLSIEEEAGWAPQQVWTVCRGNRCLAATMNRTPYRLSHSLLTISTTLSRVRINYYSVIPEYAKFPAFEKILNI